MMEMHEFDKRIKREMTAKANKIELSPETFAHILNGIEKKPLRKIRQINFKTPAAAILCSLLFIFGAALAVSPDTRVMAMEVVNTIKTVFVMDRVDSHKIVEKPANQVYLTPAITKNTEQSDEDISKKMGIKIIFPKTLSGGYTIARKAEAVGFTKSMDYDTYMGLQNMALKAIDNEGAFKTLEMYEPYRSAGCEYKNKKDEVVYFCIYNKMIPVNNDDVMRITKTMQIKIGEKDAKWIDVSFLDYGAGDMAQKPTSEKTAHLLIWSKNNSMYEIMIKGDQKLAMADIIKIAEEFIKSQN